MPVKTETIWADRAAKEVLLIRILAGWVFLSEDIQKFLFPDSLGVGRFVKIGIPWPQVMAPFVRVVEIVCGSLLLIGLVTRLATVPLLIVDNSARTAFTRLSIYLCRRCNIVLVGSTPIASKLPGNTYA
jgi:hypothetical protein